MSGVKLMLNKSNILDRMQVLWFLLIVPTATVAAGITPPDMDVNREDVVEIGFYDRGDNKIADINMLMPAAYPDILTINETYEGSWKGNLVEEYKRAEWESSSAAKGLEAGAWQKFSLTLRKFKTSQGMLIRLHTADASVGGIYMFSLQSALPAEGRWFYMNEGSVADEGLYRIELPRLPGELKTGQPQTAIIGSLNPSSGNQ